ncbi:MAG TPA: hypothetical protein VMU36_03285 [Spirochaetia bacterium]|nr:hypothetical protein [Spirochaetia bacterium]
MKLRLFLFLAACATGLLVVSCALLQRKDTVAYPMEGGPGPAPAGVFVDKVDVDRRVLSREVGRDVEALLVVLAPENGFAVTAASDKDGCPLRVHVVERETIRDFTPQYAIMVSLEMFVSNGSERPSLTVVHTSESADSISSPWILKRILNDCLKEAARAFAAGGK